MKGGDIRKHKLVHKTLHEKAIKYKIEDSISYKFVIFLNIKKYNISNILNVNAWRILSIRSAIHAAIRTPFLNHDEYMDMG